MSIDTVLIIYTCDVCFVIDKEKDQTIAEFRSKL